MRLAILLLSIGTLGPWLAGCGAAPPPPAAAPTTVATPIAATAATPTPAPAPPTSAPTSLPAATPAPSPAAATAVPATSLVPPAASAGATTVATPAATVTPIRQTQWLAVLAADPRLEVKPESGTPDRPFLTLRDAREPAGYPELDRVVYADLDGDGAEEAVIPLFSGGTAGTIAFLVYRQASPLPRLVTWGAGYKLLLTAAANHLLVREPQYAGWEPNCCPSGFRTVTYRLDRDALVATAERSEGHPDGLLPTVERFYTLLAERQYRQAYDLLSPAFQAANPYPAWAAGYERTRTLEFKAGPGSAADKTVQIELTATDAGPGGQPVTRRFAGAWTLHWEPARNGWLLDRAAIRELTGPAGPAAKPGPHPVFAPILGTLTETVKVPLRLPAALPEAEAGRPLYAVIQATSDLGYVVEIAFTPDCRGATACHLGGVAANRLVATELPTGGEAVTLAGGLTGAFTQGACGATCSDSTLSWPEGDVLYTVALKAGAKAALIAMADSAITASPPAR